MRWHYHKHAKAITIFIALCLILLSNGLYAQSVWHSGKYTDYTVLDCFKNSQYKETFKPDSVKLNYILKGQKIWRTIHLDNKENARIFTNTSKCAEIGLFEIMKYGLFIKKLNAFSSDNFNDVAPHHINEQQLLTILLLKDSATTTVFDANGNETMESTKTNRYLLGSDITQFMIKENWVSNSYTGKLEKVMIGIAPLYLNKQTGKTAPLFWLYYPEWRELLASFEAKNYYSDERISFDDVLNRKLFISVISKENNQFDRSVKSTNRGKDFYLESELIKEKIINYEEDLFQH